MDAAVNPASIAIWVSVGSSLLAGVVGMWVATRARNGTTGHRDVTVAILFGIAVVLMLLLVVAAALSAIGGTAYLALLKAALLLTAAFAVLGTGCGLMRGLNRARGIKPHSV